MENGKWQMANEIPDVFGCHIVEVHYSTMGIGKWQMRSRMFLDVILSNCIIPRWGLTNGKWHFFVFLEIQGKIFCQPLEGFLLQRSAFCERILTSPIAVCELVFL